MWHHVRALRWAATVAAATPTAAPDSASDTSQPQSDGGAGLLSQIIRNSECDFADVVSDVRELEAGVGQDTGKMLDGVLIDVAISEGRLDALPERLQRTASVLPGEHGQPAQLEPDSLVNDSLVLVLTDGTDCDCFSGLQSAIADTGNTDAYVVTDLPGAEEAAAAHGWKTIGSDVITLSDLIEQRPAAGVIKNSVSYGWLQSADQITTPQSQLEQLANPIDIRQEPLDPRYLGDVGSCDGLNVAGAYVNATDRPSHAAAVVNLRPAPGTGDPTTLFYDIGPVGPWGSATYEFTLQDEFGVGSVGTPCTVSAEAVYTDGEMRLGTNWAPGQPPADFVADPMDVLAGAGVTLPETQIPSS